MSGTVHEDYRIIGPYPPKELEEEVKHLLSYGYSRWEVLGPPFMMPLDAMPDSGPSTFVMTGLYQAMARKSIKGNE